jgi:hypothetical protein
MITPCKGCKHLRISLQNSEEWRCHHPDCETLIGIPGMINRIYGGDLLSPASLNITFKEDCDAEFPLFFQLGDVESCGGFEL